MKKSLLALAVASAAFVATSVSATPVYNKDGTSLDVGGRIEALWFSGSAHKVSGTDDQTIRNRARLNIAGRTQITNGIAAYGFTEWQSENAGDSSKGQPFETRDQYVGVDFGQFGKVQAGRWEDFMKYVVGVTDHFEEYGLMAAQGKDRNSGKLAYQWSGYGFDAKLTYQFATNKYSAPSLKNVAIGDVDVNDGFSVVVGYTSPKVLFGPIAVRTGYQYLDGQNDEQHGLTSLDHLKLWNVGLSWGTFGQGFYIGADYGIGKTKLVNLDADNFYSIADDKADELTTKSIETVVSYGFDSGVVLSAGYQWQKEEMDNAKFTGTKSSDRTAKLVQFTAAYNINPNFRVWAEANIDAGSDDYYSLTGQKFDAGDSNGSSKDAENIYAIGARYTF